MLDSFSQPVNFTHPQKSMNISLLESVNDDGNSKSLPRQLKLNKYLYMAVIQNALNRHSTVGECMSRPVDVGELRVGGYMMIEGEPCKIVDIAKSKPGKHGSAKFRIVAIGVFDGQKRQFVKPVDLGAEIPLIDKRPGQVFAINPTGVQIMDLETYEYLDAPFPEEEDLKAKLTAGAEIEYWKILGRVKIVRVK